MKRNKRQRKKKPPRTLAAFLREKRRSKNQSQKVAAETVGVTRQTWISWEQGAIPTGEHLVEIARWAEVKLDDLEEFLRRAA